MNEAEEFDHLPEMTPPQGDGNEWTVEEFWESPFLACGMRVVIRKGFVTDGASIPRIAWTLIGSPMEVPLLGPALCHDALYCAELVPDHATADDMFLEFMKLAGIGWAKRRIVWAAVRCFGGFVWAEHTPASIAASRNMCALVDVAAGQMPEGNL
jgi:hypothetical protein